jgi:hypothetical protein
MVRAPGTQRGEIRRLFGLLSEHGEAIEADLARYYHLALADLFTGRLSWRRLDVLLAALPLDSATVQARYGETISWTANEHLLAGTLDALNQIIWQLGGGKGSRPKRLTRPGQRPQPMGRTNRPTAEVQAYLDRFKPRRDEVMSNGT